MPEAAYGMAPSWLLDSTQVNHYVDVTETFECKVAALRLHQSQTSNRQDLTSELRERIAPNTAAAQLPADRLAEALQVVITGSSLPPASSTRIPNAVASV